MCKRYISGETMIFGYKNNKRLTIIKGLCKQNGIKAETKGLLTVSTGSLKKGAAVTQTAMCAGKECMQKNPIIVKISLDKI